MMREHGSRDAIEFGLRRCHPLWHDMVWDLSYARGSARDTYVSLGRIGMDQFEQTSLSLREASMDAEIGHCIAMSLGASPIIPRGSAM